MNRWTKISCCRSSGASTANAGNGQAVRISKEGLGADVIQISGNHRGCGLYRLALD